MEKKKEMKAKRYRPAITACSWQEYLEVVYDFIVMRHQAFMSLSFAE